MARTGETIYERKDGQFEGRYMVSRDENGKANYAYVYGRNKEEVREKLRIAKSRMSGTEYAYEKTFREAAEDWLDSRKEEIAATTYGRYVEALRRDIYPEYADTPVKDIKESEIERFLLVAPEHAAMQGRKLKQSTLQLIRVVMLHVIQYANEFCFEEQPEHSYEKNPYEALSPAEMERVCKCAKYNPSPEMLAVMLTLFCGIRTGELCALNWEDVSFERREIYIHRSVHRVKNQEPKAGKRTVVVVDEIPTKKHIRRVEFPEELTDYIKKFYASGKNVLTGYVDLPMEVRTLENRMKRTLGLHQIKDINFQRLRKTYVNNRLDRTILRNIFEGKQPSTPCANVLDMAGLTNEMVRDLASLRMLIGLSTEEMSVILGIPGHLYKEIEDRKQDISWNQFLALLFIFHYNDRTQRVVDTLGLYPEALKEKLKI